MALRPIYSTRFLAWQASSLVPAYTVPAGYVAVVRDCDVYSGGGSLIDFELSVNGVAKFWAGQFTIESIPQWQGWRGRQVLFPGEELFFQSQYPTDGLCSGYLLLNP